jgi:hypothetical protein
VFTGCTSFACRFGLGGGGDSSLSSGGAFLRNGVVVVVGEEVVDEGPEMGGGLRSLRMKRALVLFEGGSGNSFVGLGEREEVLAWSLVIGVEVAFARKRRMPFITNDVYGGLSWLYYYDPAGEREI